MSNGTPPTTTCEFAMSVGSYGSYTADWPLMADVRHIVIAVDGSESPTVDITGFTVFEAYQILCGAAEEVGGTIPDCQILGLERE